MKPVTIEVSINGKVLKITEDQAVCINELGDVTLLTKSPEFPDSMRNTLGSRENGFSLLYISGKDVLLAVDRIRSFPLYYSIRGLSLYISDDASWIKSKLGQVSINGNAAIEFYQAGFVTGQNTLYNEISTLQAGECVFARGRSDGWEIKADRYFEYVSAASPRQIQTLLNDLDSILEAVFFDLVSRAKGRTLVVPLSGGLDSRLIIHWLRRMDCENVVCYSFGTPQNSDCRKARQIAGKLGYTWHFIELTRALWMQAWQSREYHRLKKHYSGYCSVMSSQEFPAFLHMVSCGMIPEDSVIIPGHTGDFISGGHIPGNLSAYGRDMETALAYICAKHFSLWKTMGFSHRKEELNHIRQRVADQIGRFGIDSTQKVAQTIEYYDWSERQSKFIIQFNNVYKLFGYAFELPLWSKGVMDFFMTLPLELKLNKALYRRYLTSFDRFGLFADTETKQSRSGNRFLAVLKKPLILPLLNVKYQLYDNWLYKQFLAYFKDDLNFYTPFGYWRLISSMGRYRNPNAFFVQDYLKEIRSGRL